VVVDDASTDGTSRAVLAAHPEVRVLRLDRQAGAAARNAGMRALTTEYVALCDDDSWWREGDLARAADLMDANPRLAVINARVLVGPDEREDPLNDEMAASPLPAVVDQPGRPLLSFIACAVLVRREAVLAVGGFDARLLVGGEEELVGWDLASAGWQMSYVPELIVHHHPPPHDGRPERREIGIRNELWTAWLRRPAGPAARRTARVLRHAPRDRVTARGVARAVAGAPWVLRERQVSPPHIERLRRLLDDQQLHSRARRHI
jgi:GT2 family glycosyltransferase